jgi:hypothetical protein
LAEEIAGSPLEIREIAEEALELQRHLLRRAWGVLYATYSVAFFLTLFSSVVAYALGVAAEYTSAAHVAVDMLASGAALILTLRAFGRIRDTAEIRSLVLDGGLARVLRYRVLVPTWVAVYAVVIPSMFLFSDKVGLLVLVIYAGFWGFLYYALRLSFPRRLPSEATAALALFGIAIAGSVVLLLSTIKPLDLADVYGLLWGATVVGWAASALYARTRKFSVALEGEAR